MAAAYVTTYDGDNFGIGMGMRRHLEVRWKLDAQDDNLARFRRITDQGGNLNAPRKGWIILPHERIWHHPDFGILCHCRDRECNQTGRRQQNFFMRVPPMLNAARDANRNARSVWKLD